MLSNSLCLSFCPPQIPKIELGNSKLGNFGGGKVLETRHSEYRFILPNPHSKSAGTRDQRQTRMPRFTEVEPPYFQAKESSPDPHHICQTRSSTGWPLPLSLSPTHHLPPIPVTDSPWEPLDLVNQNTCGIPGLHLCHILCLKSPFSCFHLTNSYLYIRTRLDSLFLGKFSSFCFAIELTAPDCPPPRTPKLAVSPRGCV